MNVDDLRTRLECVRNITGGMGFGGREQVQEDRWFREHEAELIAAAKARQTAAESQCSQGDCHDSGDQGTIR